MAAGLIMADRLLDEVRYLEVNEPTRLILFDIDGTLIRSGALWKDCYERGLLSCVPECETIPYVGYSGKTDPQICQETLEHLGFDRDRVRELTPRIIQSYLDHAQAASRERAGEVRVLPGVRALLEMLSPDRRGLMGLLTGNVRRGASLKLSLAGLESHFPHEFAGAWGDDHANRYELPRIAVERVARETGRLFQGKEIVIIGDTVHDVNCGRSLGVRAIAVGTGKGIRKEDLLAQEPDFYFDDFSDTESVMTAIFGEIKSR